MAGVGGGYLSLVRVPQWTEGMTGWGRLDCPCPCRIFGMETLPVTCRSLHFWWYNNSSAKLTSNWGEYKHCCVINGSISCNNIGFSGNINESIPWEQGSSGMSRYIVCENNLNLIQKWR